MIDTNANEDNTALSAPIQGCEIRRLRVRVSTRQQIPPNSEEYMHREFPKARFELMSDDRRTF